MLRLCFVQQCCLGDEVLQDLGYDSRARHNFVGIDLAAESVPDATTLLKFRHLREKQQMTQVIFEEIKAYLAEKGLMMREGTEEHATLVAVPPSTKNRVNAWGLEMHQALLLEVLVYFFEQHFAKAALSQEMPELENRG